MSIRVAAILLTLVLCGQSSADPSRADELLAAARRLVPVAFSDEELKAQLQAGLKHPTEAAVAVAIPGADQTLVFVLLEQFGGSFVAVDASSVESRNFGKLGRPASDYERYESRPIEWIVRDDGLFQVVIQTRAWRQGQRYTVSEPLIIKPDGTVLYR